jgi:cell division protein FtsB
MAVCLDYQTVYFRRQKELVVSWGRQIASVLVLLIVLAFKVSTRLSITSAGYDLQQARQTSEALNQKRRDLEYQLAVLSKHDYLDEKARSKLGLKSLRKGQIERIY